MSVEEVTRTPECQLLHRLQAELECARLVHDVADLVDRKEFDQAADLFHREARFQRPRQPESEMVGREAILRGFLARPSREVSRHVISNVRVSVLTSTSAMSQFTLVLYTSAAAAHTDRGLGAVIQGQILIADMKDEYVRTAEGWRIFVRGGRIALHS